MNKKLFYANHIFILLMMSLCNCSFRYISEMPSIANYCLSQETESVFEDQSSIDRNILCENIHELINNIVTDAPLFSILPHRFEKTIENAADFIFNAKKLSKYDILLALKGLEIYDQDSSLDNKNKEIILSILSFFHTESKNIFSSNIKNIKILSSMIEKCVLKVFSQKIIAAYQDTIDNNAKESYLFAYTMELMIDYLVYLLCLYTVEKKIPNTPPVIQKCFALEEKILLFNKLYKEITYMPSIERSEEQKLIITLTGHMYLFSHAQTMNTFFNKGGMQNVLENVFFPFTLTPSGKKTLKSQLLPPIDRNHAEELYFKQKQLFDIAQHDDHYRSEAIRILQKISTIQKNKDELNIREIQANLSKFIPEQIFKGEKAHAAWFALRSFMKQTNSALIGGVLSRVYNYFTENGNAKSNFQHTLQNDKALLTYMEQSGKDIYVRVANETKNKKPPSLWSIPEALVPPLWRNFQRTTSPEYELFGPAYKQTFGDHRHFAAATFGGYADTFSMNPWYIRWMADLAAVPHFIMKNAFEIGALKDSYTNIYEQFIIFQNTYRFLELCSQEVECVKELINVIKESCVKNKIPTELLPSSVRAAIAYIEDKEVMYNLSKRLAAWTIKGIGLITNPAIAVLMPGLLTHYYITYLKDNPILRTFDNAIGEVDASCTKCSLLETSSESKPYTIPEIDWNSSNPYIQAEKIWYPPTENAVQNDINLGIPYERNIILTAPFMSGKTVLFSTMVMELRMMMLGVVPAHYFKATYFDALVDYIEHSDTGFKRGEGISSHRSDRDRILNLKKISRESIGFIFLIIDELYRGSSEQSALSQAKDDMPELFENNSLISLISIHYNSLQKLACPEFSSRLYYMSIQEPEEGIFVPEYKFTPDDENNWYHVDPAKNDRYRKWSDEKTKNRKKRRKEFFIEND